MGSTRLRLIALAITAMISTALHNTEAYVQTKTIHKEFDGLKLVVKHRKKPLKPFKQLKDSIIYQESKGNPTIVSSSGFMGLYQIGTLALQDIGMSNKVSLSKFTQNPNCFPPELQHKCFEQIIINNVHYMRNHMKYVGDTIGGVVIDTSALVMGAHGIGQKAVKRFLESNGHVDMKEGNGIPVSFLMRKFHGYHIPVNELKGLN